MALKLQNRFPGGNGRLVRLDTSGEQPEIVFAAEPHGGEASLWFCFRLIESDPDQPLPAKLKITLLHADTLLSGASAAQLHPVYQPEKQGWYRATGGVESHTPDGRGTVSWQIPYPTPMTLCALCFPYGRRDLETLVSKCRGFWTSDAIGLSQGGRSLMRLSNSYGSTSSPTPGIYLLGRQQAGDTPASWVMDGLLQRLSKSKRCPVAVWTVPFADPDGVEYGDYGKGRYPWALSQAWSTHPSRHEALVIQQDMQRWKARTRPLLVLDLRAAEGADTTGVHCQLPGEACERAIASEAVAWANTFKDALREWAAAEFERPGSAADSHGMGVVDYAAQLLSIPALSLAVPYSSCGKSVMSQKLYREVGDKLADAITRRALDLARH
jgi:hypothetical protein